jgi:hypothetical protein
MQFNQPLQLPSLFEVHAGLRFAYLRREMIGWRLVGKTSGESARIPNSQLAIPNRWNPAHGRSRAQQ